MWCLMPCSPVCRFRRLLRRSVISTPIAVAAAAPTSFRHSAISSVHMVLNAPMVWTSRTAHGAAAPTFSDRLKRQTKRPAQAGLFHFGLWFNSAGGGEADDQAADGVDEEELVVDADPALVAARFCEVVTAVITTIHHVATLTGRQTLAAIPAVLLDDDLLGGDLTFDGDAAMAVIVAALGLRHRGCKNGGCQKNGDELFHGSFLSCFDEENLRINE
ncbi:hypothetical protein AGR8A_Cc40119 [Agrobacterium fabrum str. J-07]|nr:hypothetical protein AGR8A_Cc40119 [Agrobacterium fabrum str. J-07]